MLGVSLYGSILVLPQYLQNSLGFTATLSGLTILVRARGGDALHADYRDARRARHRSTCASRRRSASSCSAVSNWILAGITTPQSQFGTFIVCLIISGIGLSQIFVPLSIAVLGGVPDKEVPSTSAFFNLSRQVGGSIATAVLVTLLVRGQTAHQTQLAAVQTLQHEPTADLSAGKRRRAVDNARLPISRESSPAKPPVQSYADTSRAVAVITILARAARAIAQQAAPRRGRGRIREVS